MSLTHPPEKEEAGEQTLTPKSRVTVGILLTIAGLLISILVTVLVGGGKVLWEAGNWVGDLKAQLNTIQIQVGQITSNSAQVEGRLRKLELDNETFIKEGSPALRPKIELLKERMDTLYLVGSPKLQDIEKRLTAVELIAQRQKP